MQITQSVNQCKPRRERDSQRAKVYRAEEVLESFAVSLPEIKDIEGYVQRVWASKRVQAAFAFPNLMNVPRVHDGRGRRRPAANASMIKMPRWCRNTHIVLHELAHVIAICHHGRGVAWHGWQYCSVYLKLVLCVMGREAHNALKASFQKHRVRFRPKAPRKPLTPEQRMVMVARFAAARATIEIQHAGEMP